MEQEQNLEQNYGTGLIFQFHRINLDAKEADELEGKMLFEVKVEGDDMPGNDPVSQVKKQLLGKMPPGTLKEGEQLTWRFGRVVMEDKSLFFSDHFMSLPAWIQVYIHTGSFGDVQEVAKKLNSKKLS